MSEEQDNSPSPEQELDALKAQADLLGITYHPSIGAEKLRAKITEAQETPAPSTDSPSAEDVVGALVAAVQGGATEPAKEKDDSKLTPQQIKAMDAKKARREAMKLVRVEVTCMDPNMADYTCQVFTAGNARIKTVRRVVPFNVETHVENIILKQIKEVKYQHHYDVKDEKGRKIQKQILRPSFAVNILNPLSEQELKDLAQRQAMASGTQEEVHA